MSRYLALPNDFISICLFAALFALAAFAVRRRHREHLLWIVPFALNNAFSVAVRLVFSHAKPGTLINVGGWSLIVLVNFLLYTTWVAMLVLTVWRSITRGKSIVQAANSIPDAWPPAPSSKPSDDDAVK